ncbi:MAG: hypothetical protein Q8L86_13005 [Vicinamibacterales bacterium]|nr:hypothetical protein [Vicinamibacterales bacterium]
MSTLIRAFLVVALLGAAACVAAQEPRTGPAVAIHDLTGAHTRVVWVQHDGTDVFAAGRQLVLMGLDTDDGRGERVILGERGSYVKPHLTPRGDRIVFSTHPELGDPAVHVINFDGTGLRQLEPGFALDVWEDPADGGAWVYIGTGHDGYTVRTITRVRLDDPSRREAVWTAAPVTIDTFQVSPDGRAAGANFPWPRAGVADLAAGTWRELGDGCWTGFHDVGTPLFWIFDGAHRNLLLIDTARDDRRWTVPINTAPGFTNPEVYHPRWTAHPRFMTMTGPYDQGGANQVRSGGAQSEVWIGRFSADYTAIEAWARVTANAAGDSYPDVWIDRSASPHLQRASGRVGPAAGVAAIDADRLVVEARLVTAGDVPTPESIAPYRNALVVHVYEILNVVEGAHEGRQIIVAQWAIRDAQVLPTAVKRPGETVRLTLERYAAHPELEGERVIQAPDVPDLPLYYEVGS